jgi:alpha-tubulin suppressor-like RCC1 family protein
MPHSRTKSTRALTLALSAGFLLLAACDADDPTSPLEAPGGPLMAAMSKTDVCHRTTDGDFTKISVADAAYDIHIAHGDGGIGDPVPGMTGYNFDDGCQPVEAAGLDLIPATITAGGSHTCGLDLSGEAYCWGNNWHGQLGDGSTTGSHTPVAVVMPTGASFAAISAGEAHTAALTTTGIAYAWGSNYEGLLGTGTPVANSSTPVAVLMPPGESFAAIDAGDFHTVALTAKGAAYGWGFNWDGQLGDGTTTDSGTPVAVVMPAGESFIAISAGREHSVALTGTGTAYAWGANWDGQLGDGTTTESSTPVAVSMPAGESFAAISAGWEHTVALTANGAAYAWGSDNTSTPVAVAMPTGVSFAAISGGARYTVALTSTGIAYAWGRNMDGQLGDGTTMDRSTPVPVDTDQSFAAINASFGFSFRGMHTAAITTTGAAYAWGSNAEGKLGDGTTTASSTPVAVSGGITFAH